MRLRAFASYQTSPTRSFASFLLEFGCCLSLASRQARDLAHCIHASWCEMRRMFARGVKSQRPPRHLSRAARGSWKPLADPARSEHLGNAPQHLAAKRGQAVSGFRKRAASAHAVCFRQREQIAFSPMPRASLLCRVAAARFRLIVTWRAPTR